MASKILLKKSTTASAVPTTSDVDVGEVAVNTEDKRLFTQDNGGSVVELGTTPSSVAVTGNATVGGTLGVTGTTTLGTANITTATVSSALSVPTPTQDAHAASKGYVDTEVSSAVATVIDSSPAALDTLNELAAALGDDPNFSATITTSIGTKLPKDGSEAMSGNLDLGTNKVVNVVDPTSAQDAATKTYVDTADATKLNLSGGTMTGDITMGANSVTSTATPSTDDELTRKGYVDSILGSATSAATSATAAATSASEAATSASNASTSATNAATSATNAAASYDDFDDRYLGAKATAPAVDNDGDALITGALYFDTTAGAMYVYDGSAWDQVALTPGDFLTVNNNLSDLSNTATAISNLGITATAAELNYVDGVTSNIQTQIDNIDVDPTKGTLTKTFANGEQASITLSGAISPAPVVSVTKEVAQVGITSKGGWDVATDGANYELHDTAYDTTLTPGTVGFSIADASYDSKSFSVSSQETQPASINFNADGTKMFIIGFNGDDINQYTLSTAYDISTASFDSVTFSVASQETTPSDLKFNADGTKMFVLGRAGDDVNEYSLTTAYDISTATFTDSFSVASQEPNPNGLFFNSDGTKMFITGQNSNRVFEYALTTGFDVSTASYSSKFFSVSSQEGSVQSLTFNTDGTKMLVSGSVSDKIHQYSLSTAFDVSTASYDNINFSIASQDTSHYGLAFNQDGTKMYLVGATSAVVFQYSTVKDALVLGSGSFASTDVGKRIVGNGGEAILTATDGSYSEVTAFNDSSTIASGSWSMFGLDVDSTEGLVISNTIIGYGDASTWSYDSVSFNLSAQVGRSEDVQFNSDGTKMYALCSNPNDSIFQYSLSTAFDISTASYDSVSFSVASQEGNPVGFTFKPDGTKMYMIGNTNDTVYQYTLSTAFDLSTASYDSVSFSVASQDTVPFGVVFSPDGTKMYVAGGTNDDVFQYTLSTAWDVSTATYSSKSLDISAKDTAIHGLALNGDGTKIYVVGQSSDQVHEYTLSTAYDVSTGTFNSSFSVASQDINPTGIVFNSFGNKFYMTGETNAVYQYSSGQLYCPASVYHVAVTKAGGQIDTAFWTDINTMTADETLNGGEVYYAVSTDDRTTWAVIDDTDGVRPIVRNNAGTWEYNDASTYAGTTWTSATTNEELYALQEALEDGNAEDVVGFDIASGSYDSVSVALGAQSAFLTSIAFNDDGTKLYYTDYTNNDIYERDLSTAWDVSTATYNSVTKDFVAVSGIFTGNPVGIEFKPDGTKLYVMDGTSTPRVWQFALSTAWDLSTLTFDSATISLSATDSTYHDGLAFKPDGTKMYVTGDADKVYQYSLSTAWSISTATYDSVSFYYGSQALIATDLEFNTDGTKMYVIDRATNDVVYEYDLSTAWDLSTASYNSVSFDVSAQGTAAYGMQFKDDGTKLYVINTSNTVYQYSTGTTGNFNRMNSTQLNAVTDPNHYTLGDTLDLALMLYTDSAGSIPESDGVSINYDAEALNKGAVVGTDYDFDFPDSTTVRITSNAAQNLKVRVV